MFLALDFKFDAAHRLMHHQGLCRNLHGHTWRVRVWVTGSVDSRSGMVMDFSFLKKQIRDVLADFDHAALINAEDEKLRKFLGVNGLREVLIDGEPTCENLARELFGKINKVLPYWVRVVKIRVWESETTSVLYERGKESE